MEPVRSEDASTETDEEPHPPLEIQDLERRMSELLNFLGKKHTLAIQRNFAYSDGPLRFSDLEEAIDIAPNTLSTRLTEFTEVGLLTRHAYNEIPPRVEYEMTDKARDLKPLFDVLGEWTRRHELEGPSAAETAEPSEASQDSP
jgi:DNA-binding HxlR family transcriptional regulator